MDIYEEYLEGKKLDELLEDARVRREEGEGLDGEKSLERIKDYKEKPNGKIRIWPKTAEDLLYENK